MDNEGDKKSSSPSPEKEEEEGARVVKKEPKTKEEEPEEDGHHTKDSKSTKDSKESKKKAREERKKFKDGEPGREYECVLCDCKFFTLGQHAIHIESFEHRKRVIQKAATKAYGKAPDYHGGGPGTGLPPGLAGRRVVHCKVCNVFTNSAKQLAEHLGGGRHKQLCFKLNVPVTTLELTSDDVHTLDATRLEGSKLVCKHCSVELNSKQQYDAHMKSKNHELRVQNKSLHPMRKIKRELKIFFKNKKKEEREQDGPDAKRPKRDHRDNRKRRAGEKDSGSEEEGDSKNGGSSKAREKYKLNLLDDLNELPSLRNEITFANCDRKHKKPKPAPFMCDICQVFCKSAYQLNEHLTSEEHGAALKKLLADEQPVDSTAAGGSTDDKSGEVSPKEKKETPVLYCEVCQLMLSSLGSKLEHEKSKKHKFLQELRKGIKTEKTEPPAAKVKKDPPPAPPAKVKAEAPAAPAAKVLHCSTCREDVETDMKEHLKSKKHRFLAELKPGAGRRWPEDSGGGPSSHNRRNSRPPRHEEEDRGRTEELPELVALALERKALQAELAKRRQEIEVQRRLVEELREEQRMEEEKAALRRMINECRELIEERNRRAMGTPQPQGGSRGSRPPKSVQWHPDLDQVREFREGGDRRSSPPPTPPSPHSSSSSRSYGGPVWEREEIPLLGPPLDYDTNHGGPGGRSEESAPFLRERPLDGMNSAFPVFEPREDRMRHEPGLLSWRPEPSGARMSPPPQRAEPPVWAAAPNWGPPDAFLQEQPPLNDWQRPVLSTPWQGPQEGTGFLGGGGGGGAWPAEEAAPSPWLQSPPTSWGCAENVRIPGLDFV